MNSTSKHYKTIETKIIEDANGDITKSEIIKTNEITKSDEPDYIKLYTKVWCEFNDIPTIYRNLFLLLASNMTYANTNDKEGGQLVNAGEPLKSMILKELKWKERNYYKGLKTLCETKAIKKIMKGVYQINPSYAARGSWFYNARTDSGGIKDLKATFDFINKTVSTEIVWADDGKNTEFNEIYRDGLQVKPKEETVLTNQIILKEAFL